jgi:hypothetical protein
LSPLQQYTALFAGFMPGGTIPANQSAAVRALQERKSVLDLSLRQISRLEALAPAAERTRLEIHAQAIRDIEAQLTTQIRAQSTTGACTVPAPPDGTLGKGYDGTNHNDYPNPKAPAPDDPTHAIVGGLHMGVLKAAFVCDLIRVATFQWSPGTNHVAFQGLYPPDPAGSYMHNPLAHRIGEADTLIAPPNRSPVVDFLSNVQTWYNARMAGFLADWKNTVDAYGGNLLDQTVIPFLTEIAATGALWSPLPALLFGGKALGIQNGSFWSFNNRPLNDLWITLAQAFGLSVSTPPFSLEKVAAARKYTGVIDGLWAKPA